MNAFFRRGLFLFFSVFLFLEPAFAFSDIDSPDVNFLKVKSVLENSDKFFPDKNITREDFVVWALKNTGYFGTGSVKEPFSDVSESDAVAPYAAAAWKAGAIGGSEFLGRKKISRLDAVKILFALEGIPSGRVFDSKKLWKDEPNDPVSKGILQKAVQLGFLSESSEGKILPRKFLSRLEAAQMLKKVSVWRTSQTSSGTSISLTKGRNFGNFDAVLKEIQNNYVHNDMLDKTALSEGAINGMLESLKDPYSVYFNKKQAKEFLSMFEDTGTKDQSIIGIGVQIATDTDGQLVILNIIPNGGASTAGLLAGDIILSVDGVSLKGKSTEEASSLIQGKEGTTVVLEITRNGSTFPVTIVRKKVEVKGIPNISYEVRDGVLWIRANIFSEDVGTKFHEILAKNVSSETKGIIVDLRNNGGGLLDTSVSMLNEFLPKDAIALRLISPDENTSVRFQKTGGFLTVPVVVFQNEYSASASEIFAGALQDNKRAKIIGRKSFGKGSAQEFITFLDGSALKLTINEWRTPNGNVVNAVGIKPDTELQKDASDEIYFQEAKRAFAR